MKKRIAIVGAGELGLQIAHLVGKNDEYEVYGFFDDTLSVGTFVGDSQVVGFTSDVISFFELKRFDCLLIGIGYRYMSSRKAFYEKFSDQIPFPSIIHSSCIIDASAKIGSGSVLYPGCIIDKNVVIEDNVLLNLGTVISHDTHILSHSFFSPKVTIAGFSSIGECCNLGINTTIIDNITIVDNVRTGGGTVIINDLQLSGLYVGNPAKFIR